MKYTPSEIEGSWLKMIIFVIGVSGAVVAILYSLAGGQFGAPTESIGWWAGVIVAILVIVAVIVFYFS